MHKQRLNTKRDVLHIVRNRNEDRNAIICQIKQQKTANINPTPDAGKWTFSLTQ